MEHFVERYALEAFGGHGGILVDLRNGSYFKLNSSAVRICEALRLAATEGDAIARLSANLNVPAEQAQILVASVVDGLALGASPEAQPGPLRYVSQSDGSAIFEEEGRPIFSIAAGGRTVQLVAALSDLTADLSLYLKALLPKLLALLEIPVLHAAACRVGENLLAFSGRSGAGKTTTALAFAEAGAELISEDLVILSLADGSLSMHTGGEKFARDWVHRVAPHMAEAPGRQVDFGKLLAVPDGPVVRLEAVWFVDSKRRNGADLQLSALSTLDGTIALLGNGMLATSEDKHWRDFLARSRFIAERATLSQATMPEGLGRLAAAAKSYIVNSAS